MTKRKKGEPERRLPSMEPRQVVKLVPTLLTKGRTVVVMRTPGPLIKGVGEGAGDTDFICPFCGRVIAESVAGDVAKNIVIDCGDCERLSEFPRTNFGSN